MDNTSPTERKRMRVAAAGMMSYVEAGDICGDELSRICRALDVSDELEACRAVHELRSIKK